MIKTRIFKFVGHIHNMQLCIEMISFINHENESILRWFYSFCEPRNFSLCPRSLVGVYSGGLGVWFMTFCCCLVEFGSSCFNHAWIESWFVWFGPWYSTCCSFWISSMKADFNVFNTCFTSLSVELEQRMFCCCPYQWMTAFTSEAWWWPTLWFINMGSYKTCFSRSTDTRDVQKS